MLNCLCQSFVGKNLMHKARNLNSVLLRAGIVILFAFASVAALVSAAGSENRPEDVIAFLNRTISWYRQLSAQQELVDEPNDAIYLNENRQLAEQVVRLSFDYARVQAQLLGGQASADNPTGQPVNPQYQNLADLLAKANQRVIGLQHELDSYKQQLETAGRKRRIVESEIAETQSELDLAQARKDTLRTMLDFARNVNTSGAGAGGLQAQIEELARTVPALATETSKSAVGAGSGAATAVSVNNRGERKEEPSGILALISEVSDLKRKLRLLDDSLQTTDAVAESLKKLRAPLLADIRKFTQRGDELASQPESQDPEVLAQQRKEVDGLTAQFKQLSAAMLPLGKQNILLDIYRRNVQNWRNDVAGHYNTHLKSLLFRLTILGLVLACIIGASEVWRRVTFRYVHDIRRRHQFLLLRRIVVWPLVIVIIIVAFANGLGSVTTFAGLLTAGMAVALQNLILSVVGYFFLIGKYGVRVGDRIQVSGVTGDVIDIGMVRLHLAEVGSGFRQTGRLVAFSNAVVFQPDAGIFKQIPGTNFIWHEVSLTLPPDSDYHQVEEKMLAAVNKIFADYKERMESQYRSMERAISVVSVTALHPESRLSIMQSGLQVVIRYPVELEHAAEIDDRVTREVLNATGREPKLRVLEPAPESSAEQDAVKQAEASS